VNHTQALHRRRTEHPAPEIEGELKEAYHSLQLHWLREYPEYRRVLRERVSLAARKAENRSKRVDREHEDVDYLGKEVEGCG
jgi:hypothetical protein